MKNRMMTAEEFAVNLKVLVGKVECQESISMDQFKDAMDNLVLED